jgi:predicted 3-demethylubiquinone-9 3-methyltransferase (glyoxalase superfamily)
VVLIEFTLLGQRFVGINGRPQFPFTEAVSFQIECEDQDELDGYWSALVSDGGTPGQCGWCKDRYGLSWQVTPRCLAELVGSKDPGIAERCLTAMLGMGKINIAALERAASTPTREVKSSKGEVP